MVSMFIFTILLGLLGVAVTSMFQSVRKQQAIADASDVNRLVVERLDKQVRYANAITAPGAGTTTGSTYVEWRTGILNVASAQPQTCSQWRFLSVTKQLQSRQWTEGSYSSTVSSWVNQENGVSVLPGVAIFTLAPTVSAATLPQQQLTIAYQTTVGVQQKATRATQVTFTAQNTVGSAAPTSVCIDGTRP